MHPDVRDQGTWEAQQKRRMLVGETGDPNLSATAVGILHAHGHLDAHQYAEALNYRRLRCALYGPPWPINGLGPEPSEGSLEKLRRRFNAKVRLLTEFQKIIVTDVAVFDVIPNWHYVGYLGIKSLPEDYVEKAALIGALDLMLGRNVDTLRQRAVPMPLMRKSAECP